MRFFRDRAVATLLAMWMWRLLLLLLLLQLISKEEKLNGFFLFLKPIYSIKRAKRVFHFAVRFLRLSFHPHPRTPQQSFALVFNFTFCNCWATKARTHTRARASPNDSRSNSLFHFLAQFSTVYNICETSPLVLIVRIFYRPSLDPQIGEFFYRILVIRAVFFPRWALVWNELQQQRHSSLFRFVYRNSFTTHFHILSQDISYRKANQRTLRKQAR